MAFLTSDSKDAVTLKHLTIGDDTKADLITKQADLSLRNTGVHEVSGSERKGKVSWRFEFAVEEVRRRSEEGCTPKMDKHHHDVIEGVKLLRPIRFACSTTLLDPSRARKSRVFNMIRKQIGSHIESHILTGSTDAIDNHSQDVKTPPYTAQSFPSGSSQQSSPVIQRTQRSEAPLSPHAHPRSRQSSLANLRRGDVPSAFDQLQGSPNRPAFQTIVPTSPCQSRAIVRPNGSIGGSSNGLMSDEGGLLNSNFNALRNASVVSAASSGAGSALWSPTGRPGLVPFKGRRAIVDPTRQSFARTGSVGEQGGLGGVSASQQSGMMMQQNVQASPLTIGSSLETSLTSFEGSPSPRKTMRELSIQSTSTPQATSKKPMIQQSQQLQQQVRRAVQPPSTALGLETNSIHQRRLESREEYDYDDSSARQWASSRDARSTRSRRIRAVTAEGTGYQTPERVSEKDISIPRPPTASEEIKMAYLNSKISSNVSRTNTPTNTTKPRSRHGGNGSGHGHSHSVIQAPSAYPAAYATELNPPRRLTSASIHQHQEQVNDYTTPVHQQQQPLSKNLPPTPPSKTKRIPTVAATRVISGGGNQKSFDPPEGPYWM